SRQHPRKRPVPGLGGHRPAARAMADARSRGGMDDPGGPEEADHARGYRPLGAVPGVRRQPDDHRPEPGHRRRPHLMGKPALLACDWGTTNLRAWTLDAE